MSKKKKLVIGVIGADVHAVGIVQRAVAEFPDADAPLLPKLFLLLLETLGQGALALAAGAGVPHDPHIEIHGIVRAGGPGPEIDAVSDIAVLLDLAKVDPRAGGVPEGGFLTGGGFGLRADPLLEQLGELGQLRRGPALSTSVTVSVTAPPAAAWPGAAPRR